MASRSTILDQWGNPIEKSILTQEIAGPTITGVRSPISGYPVDGLNPQRLASILREADQGEPLRYFELAEQIEERDLHYTGVLGTRKRSVAQIDVTVEAASDAADHQKHAETIRAWLLRDELQEELFDVLDAIGKGVSYTEIIWEVSEGQWQPGRLEWRDPRWFRFDRKDGATPLLRGDQGDEDLPPFKFIRAIVKAKSGLPARSGLARIAAWAWMFKAFTQRDWAIFAQTYGQPIRVGKYPAGATEKDKDTLFRAVANIAGDCAAIVPESMLIEFIESKNVGVGSDLYEKRSDWLDRQISKAVLGQTATTDAIKGGYAVGKTHRAVQEDIERADAKALSAVLNRDLVRPWIDLEYGPQKVYPRLRIARPEEKDIKTIVAAVKDLVPMGLRVQSSAMSDMLGLEDPQDDADLLHPPASAAPAGEDEEPDPGEPEPGEPDEYEEEARQAAGERERATGTPMTDEIDRLAADVETIVGPGADALIDKVRALVDSAGTLEDVRAGLLELQPNMPAAGLASLMRLALVAAELSGRADVTDR